MSKSSPPDKRQAKRYLCDEYFLECTLIANQQSLVATPIDFSKEGMGLFSNDSIPDLARLNLKLNYQSPELQYDFGSLPCTLVHFNLTEVGNHCGIRFLQEHLNPEQSTMLNRIEEALSSKDDPEDRYHLYTE